MNITIISGSTRKNSESRRVADYILSRLKTLGIEANILDLEENRLPLYDGTSEGNWQETWKGMSEALSKSQGFVFVSPEWDGMFSVGIHNMLHYADKQLADKPVLPVGVSSGRGGRYPLQHMRIMGYKNKRFVVIPESLYFDHVQDKLKDGALTEEWLEERTDYNLQVLLEYAKALSLVRQSGVIDYKKFPNGL